MARINLAAIKLIKKNLSTSIDEALREHALGAEGSAGRVRLIFALIFGLAAVLEWGNPGATGRLCLVLAVVWLMRLLVVRLRQRLNPTSAQVTANTLIDLTIVNLGMLGFFREGQFAGAGESLFLCYFPLLAVAANRYRVGLLLMAAGYATVFYVVVALLAGVVPWLSVAILLATTLVFVSGSRRPKSLVADVAHKAIDQAGEAGALQTEIALTAEAHQLFMPAPISELPGLWCAGKHGAGAVTGGDYYQIFETARGPMVILGDLGGEGFGALAEVAALHREVSRLVPTTDSPTALAGGINSWLLGRRNPRPFTCVIAEWRGEEMRYVNAGHLPMIRMSKPSGSQATNHHLLPVTCEALGVSAEVSIVESAVPFPARDLMVIYTDGIFAKLTSDREKGIAEIDAMSARFSGGEVNTLCHRIFDCAQPGYDRNPDDSTVVVIRRQSAATA